MAGPARHHEGVHGAPELVAQVGALPAAAAAPRPDAREERRPREFREALHPGVAGVLLVAVDHGLPNVVDEGALALVFAGALHFDDLPMAADPQRGVEAEGAKVVALGVLDRHHEVLVGFDAPRDVEVVVRARMEVAEVPGAVIDAAAKLHADLLAQEVHQRRMDSLGRFVGVLVIDGSVAGVVGGVVEVGLAGADHEAVEFRHDLEELGEHDAVQFPGQGLLEGNAAIRPADLLAVQFHEALRQDDDVHEVITLEADGVAGPRTVAHPRSRRHHPGALLRSLREDATVEGVEGHRALREYELVDDHAVVAVVREGGGVGECCPEEGFARIVVDHVQDFSFHSVSLLKHVDGSSENRDASVE